MRGKQCAIFEALADRCAKPVGIKPSARLIQLKFADTDAGGADVARKRGAWGEEFVVVKGVFTGIGASAKGFQGEDGETIHAADPSVELLSADSLAGNGEAVVGGGGGSHDSGELMAGLVLGGPLADKPGVDALRGATRRGIVEASGEQEEASQQGREMKDSEHGRIIQE
jgi:hypothetical protein